MVRRRGFIRGYLGLRLINIYFKYFKIILRPFQVPRAEYKYIINEFPCEHDIIDNTFLKRI